MIRRSQHCPLISALLALTLLSLSACGSSAKRSTEHPYVKEVQEIELQAVDALQRNRFRTAYHYSTLAYRSYAAIDEVDGMARNLINQAQIALLVEDLIRSEEALNMLDSLIDREQLDGLRDRAGLMRSNLAIAKKEWNAAQNHLQQLPDETAISNQALKESLIVAKQLVAWGLGEQPEFSDSLSLPLIRARQLRLEAEVALAQGNSSRAQQRIVEAKRLYQAEAFAPGIAECLVLQAKLNRDPQQNQELRAQAKLVFQGIQNEAAIKRHGL